MQSQIDHTAATLRLSLLALVFFSLNCANGQVFNYSVSSKDCEKGYLGKIDSLSLYYEIWRQPGAAGTAYNSIVLRTDTSDVSDTIDFSFGSDNADNVNDSIRVTIMRSDTSINFTTTNAKDIPTVFQILIPYKYGYQYFHTFNKQGSYQAFYLKHKDLHLSYLTRSPYDTGIITSETYKLINGQFKLLKMTSKELKD